MKPSLAAPPADEPLARLLADPTLLPPRAERGCPPIATWIDLAGGSLPAAERERALDHLATCPDCAAEVRAAREIEASVGELAPATLPDAGRRRAFGLAIAASVALAGLAALLAFGFVREQARTRAAVAARDELAGRLATLERERDGLVRSAAAARSRAAASEGAAAALARPRPNVPIVDLAPRDRVRGAGAPTPGVARSAGWVTLLLHPRTLDAASYTVEILAPAGATIERTGGLVAGADAALTLVLPTASLPAGTLRLRLLRERAGGATVEVDTFELRIEER